MDNQPFGRRRNSPRIGFVLLELKEGRRARPRNGVLLHPRPLPYAGCRVSYAVSAIAPAWTALLELAPAANDLR